MCSWYFSDGPEHRYQCSDDQFMCTAGMYAAWGGGGGGAREDVEPTCIWRRFQCDSHLNCGFKYNSDEAGCPGGPAAGGQGGIAARGAMTASTMSFLVFVYMGVVLSLILFTMAFLRWHRAFRGAVHQPPDVAEFAVQAARPTPPPPPPPTVSIMVMYRPSAGGGAGHQQHKSPAASAEGSSELPPSYESLFSQEPPTYVNLPPEETDCIGTCVQQQQQDCCECECDHSNCQVSPSSPSTQQATTS